MHDAPTAIGSLTKKARSSTGAVVAPRVADRELSGPRNLLVGGLYAALAVVTELCELTMVDAQATILVAQTELLSRSDIDSTEGEQQLLLLLARM